MLQQTQVATVIDYWRRWMERFPTVSALAMADEESVLSCWQGLGYYRRCRLLLSGARYVAEYGLPKTAEEWQRVPGVGRYTAGAIASISQNCAAALVDGNVERVFARLESDGSTGSALTRNAWKWAELNVLREGSGDWNQALMELGATLCNPIRPRCGDCPVSAYCTAHRTARELEYPVSKPKRPTVALSHRTYILRSGEHFGVRRIPEGHWWHGMYEFPRDDGSTVALELEHCDPARVGALRHVVTHHKIQLTVYFADIDTALPSLEWKTEAELASIPMPAPQRRAFALWQRLQGQKALTISWED